MNLEQDIARQQKIILNLRTVAPPNIDALIDAAKHLGVLETMVDLLQIIEELQK